MPSTPLGPTDIIVRLYAGSRLVNHQWRKPYAGSLIAQAAVNFGNEEKQMWIGDPVWVNDVGSAIGSNYVLQQGDILVLTLHTGL